jgi:CDP-diacylglycerol---serine O-phosphatidyltransferase
MTPVRYALHPANTLTYASLALGVGAVAAALAGNAAGAGALLAAASVADVLDGRFARRFDRTAHQAAFGAQLDSLCDAVVFAAAPVVCAAVLARGVSVMWWLPATVYAGCGVTRLAVYNISSDDSGFVGLPMPVAALVWSSLLLISNAAAFSPWPFALLGAAMVLPVHVPRPAGVRFAIFAVWPLAVTLLHAARALH